MDELWTGVDRLIDRAPGDAELQWHRLHLLAARRLRRHGLCVPPAFAHQERLAAVGALVAPRVLDLVRERLDGPLLLVKGPEVARRYPDPALRPLRDVDLLVPDAHAAWRRLVASGFEVLEGEDDVAQLHHRPGLVWPGLPVVVEIHTRPKWPARVPVPPTAELLARGVPSATGVEGLLTLPDPEHAVLLAAHSWAHQPLRHVGDLLDVLLLSGDAAPAAAIARAWSVERVWGATRRAAEAVLLGGRSPWPLHAWARDVPAVRRRTTLAAQLERWSAPLFELPPGAGRRGAARVLARDLRPQPGETWPAKATRTAATARDAFAAKHEHDARLYR
jgi:hypothetical protein